ncbi:MAG: TlpA disulfide reductase family protein [Chloroflexota bacterium]
MTTALRHRAGTNHKHNERQRQKKLLFGFGIGVVAILGLMLMFNGGSNAVPDFSATTITGETVHLSDYRGQVVMLNFWATWCPPCRAEMPTIEAAYEKYHDQGFAVFAINNAEQPAQIQPFAEALSLRFSIVLDTEAHLQRTFAISGYPTSLFISPDSDLYANHSGMLTPQQLDSYITTGLANIRPDPET